MAKPRKLTRTNDRAEDKETSFILPILLSAACELRMMLDISLVILLWNDVVEVPPSSVDPRQPVPHQ
jgi:hypothetical protein